MKKADLWLIAPLIVCAALTIVFGVPGIITYNDKTLGKLICEIVPRLAVSVFLIILMFARGYAAPLKVKWKVRHLIWCIPCFMVALANFPYTALAFGKASIDRTDLIWLFIIKCLSIALLEEMFFRAIMVPLFLERFKENKYCLLITVIGTSVLFALIHLLNIFLGAGVGYTMLQVGYTFLIGCMLAVILIYTKNIWLCIIVHFVFDIGGAIIKDLGSGGYKAQDLTFWILTAVAGVICAAHIIVTLIRLMKNKNT